MIRTMIIPEQQTISIQVPKSYIGKQVAVILYEVEEPAEQQKATRLFDASKFKGIFSKEEGEKFNRYIQQVRSEWDRDF